MLLIPCRARVFRNPRARWHLVRYLAIAERLRRWADSQRFQSDVFIPKAGGDETLGGQRPVSLACVVYRDYGSERIDHLTELQKEVFPPNLFGGIAERSYDELILTIGMKLAMTKSDRKPLKTIDIDQSRCFCNLTWDLTRAVLRWLGVPENVLNAIYGYCKTGFKKSFRTAAASPLDEDARFEKRH